MPHLALAIYVSLSFTTASTPLHYPIDKSILVKCEKPSPYLCRPHVSRPPEIEAYINKLRITDPAFYDVYDDNEILRLFHPVSLTTPLPFFLWDEASGVKDAVYNVPADQASVFATMYHDLKLSNWRVKEPKDARLHYVVMPWNHKKLEWHLDFDQQSAEEYLSTMMKSDWWKRFNGTDFLTHWGDWPTSLSTIYKANDVFNALQRGQSIHNFTVWDWMRLKVGGFNYALRPEGRSCLLASMLDIHEEFMGLQYWPKGSLESYQYPLGSYAQHLMNRKSNLFFVSSVDERAAYSWRLMFYDYIPEDFMKPSIIAPRVKFEHGLPSFYKPKKPVCDGGTWQNCYVTPQQATKGFPEWAMDSKWGLHLRGDDYFSSRVGEVLSSGGIVIMVDEPTLSLASGDMCHLPWRDMVVVVPSKPFWDNPFETLKKVLGSLTHNELEKKLRLAQYYRPHLFFGMVGSTAAHLRLFEYAANCVDASILGSLKAQLTCPLEQWSSLQAFPSAAGDLDDPDGYALNKLWVLQ